MTITLTNGRLILRRLYFIVAFSLFAAVIPYSLFYLFSGYEHLVKWYFSLNSCFYHSTQWSTDFFTPGIKSDGNMYCIIALLISGPGLWYLLKKSRQKTSPAGNNIVIAFSVADIVYCMLFFVSGCAAWYWGNTFQYPAHDEVFSAQNVAEIHPFQAISYYMLPNNHLLYNLVNNLLPAVTDKVVTGRIISLFAALSIMVLVYAWLKNIFSHRLFAALCSFALSLQLLTWGFSFQARGYELYLLAEWGSLISLLAYISSHQKKWLAVNALCLAAGYFTMPSVLYFHVAQVLLMIVLQITSRRLDTNWLRYQLATVLLTFLLYLPLLCFSGVESVTNNSYVVPMGGPKTATLFWHWMWPELGNYASHMFSGLKLGTFDVGPVLFLLPLLLLLFPKNKPLLLFGVFYLCMSVVFIAVAISMRRLPFERNLIGHYSIALTGVLLLIHQIIGMLSRNKDIILKTLFPAVTILCIAHFILHNPDYFRNTLYEHDVNEVYKYREGVFNVIPTGSTIAFSDAAFYAYYIGRKKGYITSKCPKGNEQYYIRDGGDPLPPGGRYILAAQVAGYEIYTLK